MHRTGARGCLAHSGCQFTAKRRVCQAPAGGLRQRRKEFSFTYPQKRLDKPTTVQYNMCKAFYFTFCTRREGQTVGKNLEMALLLDFYGDMLTDKQRSMVDYYYNDDLSLAEIAENEGITRQGVRDSIKRAEAQMLEMEERLGLSRRFRRICEQAQQIADMAGAIRRLGSFPGAPREIGEQAQRIEELAAELQRAE